MQPGIVTRGCIPGGVSRLPGAREELGAAPGAPPRVAPGLEACAAVRARAHPGFHLGRPDGGQVSGWMTGRRAGGRARRPFGLGKWTSYLFRKHVHFKLHSRFYKSVHIFCVLPVRPYAGAPIYPGSTPGGTRGCVPHLWVFGLHPEWNRGLCLGYDTASCLSKAPPRVEPRVEDM